MAARAHTRRRWVHHRDHRPSPTRWRHADGERGIPTTARAAVLALVSLIALTHPELS